MKLFVSDYDQTLSMDDLTIWINIKKVNEFRSHGNLFMLSTGRDYESIKKEINKYKISYDFLSCEDGLVLYDDNDRIIEISKLDHEDLRMSSYLKLKYKYDIEISDITSDNSKIPEIRLITVKLFSYKEIMNAIIQYLDEYLKNSEYFVKYNTIFIKPKNISKSYPIEFVSHKLGIPSNEIFTIGDHDNDAQMIHDYNGFTMLWGSKKAKEYAKKQYLTVFQCLNDIEKDDKKLAKKFK